MQGRTNSTSKKIETQEKSLTITAAGTYNIIPDTGKMLTKATAIVDILGKSATSLKTQNIKLNVYVGQNVNGSFTVNVEKAGEYYLTVIATGSSYNLAGKGTLSCTAGGTNVQQLSNFTGGGCTALLWYANSTSATFYYNGTNGTNWNQQIDATAVTF
jgi:hypothetical protein